MDQESTHERPPQPEEGYEALRDADYLGRDRASLFLTAKGVKPGCILELLFESGHEEYTEEEYEEHINDCRQIIEDLGLPFDTEHVNEEDDFERYLFFVGKDKESLETLITAREGDMYKDYPSFGTALGKALGYPETAIAADATRTALPIADYPAELKNDPALAFAVFAFSRDHWRKELDFVREQANFIKKEDPQLYNTMVKSHEIAV